MTKKQRLNYYEQISIQHLLRNKLTAEKFSCGELKIYTHGFAWAL